MMLHDDLLSWAIGLLNLYFAKTNTKTFILGTQFYTQLRDCNDISSERSLKDRIEKLLSTNCYLQNEFADLENILFAINVGLRTKDHYLPVDSSLVVNDSGVYKMIIYDSAGSSSYNKVVLMWKLMPFILPTKTDITNDDQFMEIMEIGGMFFLIAKSVIVETKCLLSSTPKQM